MGKFKQVFNWLEYVFLMGSKFGLFAMMLLVSGDAIGRYFFGKPIVGTYEIVEMYLMVVTIFLSMSYVMKIGGHIRLDVVFDKLPKTLQKRLNFFYYFLTAIWMSFIGYYGFQTTHEAWVENLTESGVVSFPMWLSYIWVPIGAFLLCIRLLIMCVNTLGPKSELKGE
ncbi:transporter [Lentibacillus kapialis]|uniref:Transporter n=1 Tax=Lentibacillus kapialis TaxID=340214 RepID=A0A917UZB2_9BACI|nr:TRAP transporter small permease [Lentibacillus kapialis]GGJ99204.1 transporter [Lentibacillus kapialis]